MNTQPIPSCEELNRENDRINQEIDQRRNREKEKEIERVDREKEKKREAAPFKSIAEKLIGKQMIEDFLYDGSRSEMLYPKSAWESIIRTKEDEEYFIMRDSIKVFGNRGTLNFPIRQDIYKNGVDFVIFDCAVACKIYNYTQLDITVKEVWMEVQVYNSGAVLKKEPGSGYTKVEAVATYRVANQDYADDSPLGLIVSKIREGSIRAKFHK
jgi:hypothetical protein